MKVFLTGVTGFLAGEILILLSKMSEVNKIFCLIRTRDDQAARERLVKVFAFHGDYYDEQKIIPIQGDLTQETLVQDLTARDDLNCVNVVIHAAANTSFSPIYRESIRKINIEGANRIFEWSSTLPELATFVYVGTSWICGTEKTNRVVYEDESPNANFKQLVEYCRSKTIGEIDVRRVIPKNKLLVVRPSIIMGDSRPWLPRSYVILWAIAAFDILRLNAMSSTAKCDIVSVDYASRAIVELLFSRRHYDTYHISSGTESATCVGKFVEAVNIDDRPPYKFVDYEFVHYMKLFAKKRLTDLSIFNGCSTHLDYWRGELDGRLRILLSAIDYYYQFFNLCLIFDNTRLLRDTSIGPPEPSHEYMARNKMQLRKIDVLSGAVDP